MGFTTPTQKGRFYPHCTDIAKTIQAPIIHVNGDVPESVLQAMEMACAYRKQFQKDIIINFTCYRRYGHNEGDEPHFTQPLMYKKIQNHQSVAQKYEQQLLAEHHLKPEDAQIMRDNVHYELTDAFNDAQKIEAPKPDQPLKEPSFLKKIMTGVKENVIFDLAPKLYFAPKGFHLHPKIKRLWNEKIETIQEGKPFDWHLGETFAFATCLIEGHSVRLSGQDCERGTFSHRHAVVIDQETGTPFTPLAHISKEQAPLDIINSPLSEYAVLGFEYGHSIDNAKTLSIWEAQFGDFANGGQIIIDQFIASGHAKWGQTSNLVLLLPHGYEGQGPEHSSARLERFLQLCAEN
ncbi:MAG: thiamine pyrophosphate-dependent enzyme, partial [Alphaproteobacteria bacterium]|nr:thiamine pyrophosphate-dependent enzyme [Alphaproteobacteria bacterium]